MSAFNHYLAAKEVQKMLNKPFRKPFRTPFANSPSGNDDSEPQPKKRRMSNGYQPATPHTKPRLVFKTPGISSLPRKPLSAVENLSGAPEPAVTDHDGPDRHYTVLWYVN